MTEKEIQQLAAEIAADLFTDGNGEPAERLVLTRHNGRSLGGWGEEPVRDRIAGRLREALNKKKGNQC